MKEKRPDPEKFLQQAQEEERQQQRGKLKIYLGASPGVGKTYSMLQDAIAQREQGLDVVMGIVETHGRKETEVLVNKLECLPRLRVPYRDRELLEFDLDAALKRHPGLILMDEMAHTNPEGLRHAKRWQDIKELLDRNIDVYTTMNVQHIESLNDVISQIVHAPIKETVPDSMIEMADTIELVDLPPEDLLKRLREGKVYMPMQANIAAENFFRKGNLTALRELALRVTAERVGSQVLLYRQGLGIKHIWPTREKLLVCVGPGAESVKLIRVIRRLASNLQAHWIAVFVDVPRVKLSDESRNSALQNLQLAEQLGAETRVLTGFDIAKEIMTFARDQNVTQIVIGKKNRSRWREFFFRSLADEIVRASAEIDVHIVTGGTESYRPPKAKVENQVFPWKIYGFALAITAIVTTINVWLFPLAHASSIIMIYLLGVTLVALFGRVGPSMVASFLSVLAYDYFFIPPYYSLTNVSFRYLFTLAAMLVVSQVISHLTILSRRRAEIACFVENQTAALHMLSRQLAGTRGVDKLLNTGAEYIASLFSSDVQVLMPENGQLVLHNKYQTDEALNPKEQSVAQWVYDLGQPAGFGTDTLPFSKSLYVPLVTSHGTLGVVKIKPRNQKIFTTEQRHLLEACTHQIALSLEVDRLQEQTRESEFQVETDRVRNALLQSVSHDLRAPLASIMASANTQVEMAYELSTADIIKIGQEIYSESEDLNRLINNLLQITYLEAESVKLEKEMHSLGDVIKNLLPLVNNKLRNRQIILNIPEELPEIPFDQSLIEEVLLNLIDNAIKFTPADTPVEISVSKQTDHLLVLIDDSGPGIVPDEVKKLFEKFYRGRLLTSERGLGLGLAICHSVIKVHGGEIWAENRVGGGASFRFTLPLV